MSVYTLHSAVFVASRDALALDGLGFFGAELDSMCISVAVGICVESSLPFTYLRLVVLVAPRFDQTLANPAAASSSGRQELDAFGRLIVDPSAIMARAASADAQWGVFITLDNLEAHFRETTPKGKLARDLRALMEHSGAGFKASHAPALRMRLLIALTGLFWSITPALRDYFKRD